ncbi:PrgI family protein [Patescibacteria group bacterium]|nr:PrgI family protein [Patescibacteria group bacterium]
MQFNVPQFIDVEDKILGPLSLKQFLMFLGGAIIVLFLWYLFRLWIVVIVAIPLFLFLLASVFVKINGRSLFTFLRAFFNYFSNPKIYIWRRKQ